MYVHSSIVPTNETVISGANGSLLHSKLTIVFFLLVRGASVGLGECFFVVECFLSSSSSSPMIARLSKSSGSCEYVGDGQGEPSV